LKHFKGFKIGFPFVLVTIAVLLLFACDMTEDTTIGTWDRTYANSMAHSSNSVIETLDGGYLVAGFNYTKIIFVKVDIDGNQEWVSSYDAKQLSENYGHDMRETGEGYVLALINPDGASARVVYMDLDGLETSAVTVSDPDIKAIKSVSLTPDNTLAVLGNASEDIVAMGFDSTGAKIWDMHFGTKEDRAQFIRKTKTGYVAGGVCDGMTRMFKLDETGGVVWRRTLPMGDIMSIGGSSFSSIDETDDGGFKVAVIVCEKNGLGCL
jgi:hypothetical protein